MSIAQLFKPNLNDLYCDNITMNTLTLNNPVLTISNIPLYGAVSVDNTININISVIANLVCLKITPLLAPSVQATYISTGQNVIPAKYHPAGPIDLPCNVLSNSVVSNGNCTILQNGALVWYVGGAGNFAGSGTVGWDQITFSYII